MTRTIPVFVLKSKQGQAAIKKIRDARLKRNKEVVTTVEEILENVKSNGDKAVLEYTAKFDNVKLTKKTMRVSEERIAAEAKKAPPELQKAIKEAAKRIEAYHRKQVQTPFTIETAEGTLSQIIRPLQRIAAHIPGGHTVYPSSVLMNVIPAKIAGVKEIVGVTPPRWGLSPGIAFALQLLGVKEVYHIGGAQAIGALAYGTESIPAVDKIVGPGNAYVATAKRMVYGSVDIDSVAGPSEVMIMADKSANPNWVALDLLAQAEHGSGDEIAICVTEDEEVARLIALQAAAEIELSPSADTLKKLPELAIAIFVTESRKETIEFVNSIAPEHLEIMTKTAKKDIATIRNAAAIFVGNYTPVALGDYFIGTNHVLPTGGTARFWSPLGVDDFVKRISVAEVTAEGIAKASPFVSILARTEKFIHHALSVEERASSVNETKTKKKTKKK